MCAPAEVREDIVDPVERLSGAFHRDQGVLESGGLGAVRDRLDFLQLLRQRGRVGGREMLVLDLIERRQFVTAACFPPGVDCLLRAGGAFFFETAGDGLAACMEVRRMVASRDKRKREALRVEREKAMNGTVGWS